MLHSICQFFHFLEKPKFSKRFEDELKTAYLPGNIEKYVRETYLQSPQEFEKQLEKAKRNSERPGIGNSNYNMWIAANLTLNRLPRSKINFRCYYCNLPLSILSPEKVHFEHFYPKKHDSSIKDSCKWCDKFKEDRTPDDFRDMMLNPSLIESDRYTSRLEKVKLKHFIPLVVRHVPHDLRSGINTGEAWLDSMIEIARTDFNEIIDGNLINRYQSYKRYFKLYRSKWLPPEINKLALAYEQE